MNRDICLKYMRNIAFCLPFSMAQHAAAANDFDAAKVMNEMTAPERSAYVAGVVEGLAVARYMKDGKQKTGMQCIYGWYYDDKATIRLIYDAFDKYPTYPPGSIIDVLVKQKCGE